MLKMTAQDQQAPVPGILMRMAQSSDQETSGSLTPPIAPCPNIEQMYLATADDNKQPGHLALYYLSDITPLLSSSDLYDRDAASQASASSLIWVVCAFINGRNKDTPTAETSTTHQLTHTPAAGSKLVINGSSPRPDKFDDYHGWYNEEHGPGLAVVPGWNENRRYRMEKKYGEVETASFYGFNYYDAENGLGGPVWQASTNTDWTRRIRSNAAKPNIRRVWKMRST